MWGQVSGDLSWFCEGVLPKINVNVKAEYIHLSRSGQSARTEN